MSPRRIARVELALRRIVPPPSWRRRVGRAESAAPSCPRPSVNGIENVIYLYSEAGGVMVNIVTVSHCSDLNVSVVGIIKFCKDLCVRF